MKFCDTNLKADSVFDINVKRDLVGLGHTRNVLIKSKEGVWGTPSSQFVDMEKKMDEVFEFAKTLDDPTIPEDENLKRYKEYQKKLEDLQEKAEAYIDYKKQKGKLKSVEKTRVNAAELVKEMADRERKKIGQAFDEYDMKAAVMSVALVERKKVYQKEVEKRVAPEREKIDLSAEVNSAGKTAKTKSFGTEKKNELSSPTRK